MTLARQTAIGIIWNIVELFGRRFVGLVLTLLLARFLGPEEYGLIATIGVFLALSNILMESGFKEGLIRLPVATQVDFNSAFYANLVFGLSAYGLLFVSAPFIAEFYEEPRLLEVVRVAGLNTVIAAFQVVQSANLIRALNFKAQLLATMLSSVGAGSFAVYLAYSGCGVWALVVQGLLASVLQTTLLWRLQGWRPTLAISLESLKSQYNFGYKLLLSGVLGAFFNNIHILVIAKLFDSAATGQYYFASTMKDIVVANIVVAIERVTFPALASIQYDAERLAAGFRRVLVMTTYAVFPLTALLVVLAEPLFLTFLPLRWNAAVPYFQLLAVGGVLYPLHSMNLNVLMVKGRSDLFLYLEIIKRSLTLLVLSFSWRYGILGMIFGQIMVSVLAYLPNSWFTGRLIGYSFVEQIADVYPVAIASVAAGSITYALMPAVSSEPLMQMFFAAPFFIVVLLILSAVFKIEGLFLYVQLFVSKRRGAT